MSPAVAAYSILGLTVTLALVRPKIGSIHFHHSHAGVVGLLLVVILGLVPLPQLLSALELLSLPIITIVSLMTITLIAERAGLFDLLTMYIARKAKGSGKRLFTLLFISGTLVGTFFTNDAAVLIFTPLVFNLVEEIQGKSWTRSNKIPYYFGVLYVANMVGALVIANPINIVVARILDIGFTEYAKWMLIPALVGMAVSFIGLRLYFRKSIPETYEMPKRAMASPKNQPFLILCSVILAATLIGFFSHSLIGIPIWLVALLGALVLSFAYAFVAKKSLTPIVKGIGWDVIVFLTGMFIVVLGARNVGLTEEVSHFLKVIAGETIYGLTFATAFVAATSSAIIDNHPTADIMAWVIQDLSLPEIKKKILALSALIGGDLGPKMSPIGSLAALMWLRLLRDRGVNIEYRLFLKVNVPITLAAVFFCVIVLMIQVFIYQHW